jgi:L-asparaginase
MPITIFTTGGTFDKVYFDSKGAYHIGDSMVHRILEQAMVLGNITIVELMRKDSLEMTDADRQTIRDAVVACAHDRIVITHGTDTLVETARHLGDMDAKSVVFTGALQPARFADSDAPFNLGMAIGIVQIAPPGVYVAANGQCLPARYAHKNRTLNRFDRIE